MEGHADGRKLQGLKEGRQTEREEET